MKKKTTKKVKVVDIKAPEMTENVEISLETPKGIDPIAVNFGREDLNQLANKINEVIDHINKK